MVGWQWTRKSGVRTRRIVRAYHGRLGRGSWGGRSTVALVRAVVLFLVWVLILVLALLLALALALTCDLALALALTLTLVLVLVLTGRLRSAGTRACWRRTGGWEGACTREMGGWVTVGSSSSSQDGSGRGGGVGEGGVEMELHVALETVGAGGLEVAVGTRERLLSGVGPHVAAETVLALETLAADCTHKATGPSVGAESCWDSASASACAGASGRSGGSAWAIAAADAVLGG